MVYCIINEMKLVKKHNKANALGRQKAPLVPRSVFPAGYLPRYKAGRSKIGIQDRFL